MNKMFKVFALLAAFALLSVSATEFTEDEGVLVLGDSSLDAALAEHEFMLVEFYAPWCGHCKKLAPEYVKAAAALKAEGVTARLAKVDCTVEKETGTKYGVKGYPTLKWFVKGQPMDYEGGRVEKDIVNYIKKKTLPSTSEVSTSEQLAANIKNSDVLVVFFGGKDHAHFGAFEATSKKYDDVGFVYTSNADLRTEHNVAEGTDVILLKKFDEGRNEHAGSFDATKLGEFIDTNRNPTVLPFDQKAAQKIFGDAIPSLFLIYTKGEAGSKAEAAFTEAAGKLKGKIQFSISDIKDGGLGPRLAEFVGIKESDTPCIRIVVPAKSGSPKKYVLDKEISVENIVQFYEDYAAGKLSTFLKSDPLPESNDAPVKIIVGHNFNDIVMDPTKDVLIEFYAPWCGHCKKLSPIWDELAEELKGVKDLVIAKMDSTANEVESVNVSGFPTLKFYPKNGKQNPLAYEGDRTKEGFLKYLKEKINLEIPAAKSDTKPDGEL